MSNTVTAMCSSFKSELLNGGHVFDGPVTPIITIANNATTTNSVSSMYGVVVGMGVVANGISANTVIAATTATSFTLSQPTTSAITASSVTITADQFYCALIKANPSGTYDNTTTNYSQVVANGDEVTGSGYTAGGVLVTNISAVTSGTTAYLTFGSNPQWTNSTFSYQAAIIYNASARISGVSGRAVGIFDFGGVQQVTGSTLSLVLPSATSSTAIIRIQ
jgi:hypothetical protein